MNTFENGKTIFKNFMQKFLIYILSMVLLASCSNDIQFNNPALQGTKNYDYWTANDFQATLAEDGSLRIIGIKKDESITLSLEGNEEGSYLLGKNSNNSIIFEDKDLKTYTTKSNGDGEIVLEDYDNINLTISGTFRFNSFSGDGSVVNFIDGVFYQIPIESTFDDNPNGSNTFNASVDAINIDSDTISTLVTDDKLIISVDNSDNSSIELHMPKFITLGQHSLNLTTEVYASYKLEDGTVSLSQYGTLMILEHDLQFKKIRGTFSFNTGHPLNLSVTNGNFIIFY